MKTPLPTKPSEFYKKYYNNNFQSCSTQEFENFLYGFGIIL